MAWFLASPRCQQPRYWLWDKRVLVFHDDVIKRKHFPRYWPFVQGIHRSPRNSPHKGQWRGTLMFSLICTWINYWVNNHEACVLRRHRAHCDVTVMSWGRISATRLVQCHSLQAHCREIIENSNIFSCFLKWDSAQEELTLNLIQSSNFTMSFFFSF